MTEFDLISAINAYESGKLAEHEALVLFSELVKTGEAWHLQGAYGRTANDLILGGWIDEDGKILKGQML